LKRQLGLSLFIAGGLTLSFAGGRYAVGAVRADSARQEVQQAEAREAVARARAGALYTGSSERPVAGAPVARIVASKIDLDAIILEGVDDDALNAGPGHFPGSVLPGERGNSIVSAHRDRHFNRIGELDVGDTLMTEAGMKQSRWVIVSKRVVDKDARALFNTKDATLTLTTCWPIRYFGPAPERLIITAHVIPSAARDLGSLR
jgi:sortase A